MVRNNMLGDNPRWHGIPWWVVLQTSTGFSPMGIQNLPDLRAKWLEEH